MSSDIVAYWLLKAATYKSSNTIIELLRYKDLNKEYFGDNPGTSSPENQSFASLSINLNLYMK